MSITEIPEGVGWTALLTAYSRAQESRAAGRLFDDPLAAEFIAAVHGAEKDTGAEFPRLGPAKDDDSSSLWNGFRFYFTQRTPFYDRLIRAGAGHGQVVMLGAGLDSRAYRLGLGEDVRFFEVDRAPMHEFKTRVLDRLGLTPTCVRVPVVADVTNGLRQSLLAAGFDPAVPTVWAAEGLLMYFTRDQAGRVLDEISALSAPGSRFAGEYFSRHWTIEDVEYETLDAQEKAAWDLLLREFRYGPVDERPADWLAAHGWTSLEETTLVSAGKQTGRPVPDEFGRPGAPQVWLFAGEFGG
jgi:methyltransferase (TIGR00027 family)